MSINESKLNMKDDDKIKDYKAVMTAFNLICEVFEMNKISRHNGLHALWNFFVYTYKEDLKMSHEQFTEIMSVNAKESKKMWDKE